MPIQDFKEIKTPALVRGEHPHTAKSGQVIDEARSNIEQILRGADNRLLLIVGPCSIHDPVAAKEYAQKLLALRQEFAGQLEIIMRVYLEKPRSVDGWAGYVADPDLDGVDNFEDGILKSRQLLIEINDMGMPCATEFLDPIIYQYYEDLISWASIGARTSESQFHRKMASGLSMTVGFKNGTTGDVTGAVNAIKAVHDPKTYVGLSEAGKLGEVTTMGNQYTHLVLRGGTHTSNYSYGSISDSSQKLQEQLVHHKVMVDCSHGNSAKDYTQQSVVCRDVFESYKKGAPVLGVMIESNLFEGAQPFTPASAANIQYGISITDPCIGWEETEQLIREAAETVSTKPSE